MEPSLNKTLVFMAGSTFANNLGTSQGILAAVKFDKSLDLVGETIVDSYDVQGCTAMKRFPDRDHLLLGCYKHLLLARFTGTGFEFLNLIEDVHSGTSPPLPNLT